MTSQTAYMKKHIVEMDESRAMMETLTVKIRGEIQKAEYEFKENRLIDCRFVFII